MYNIQCWESKWTMNYRNFVKKKSWWFQIKNYGCPLSGLSGLNPCEVFIMKEEEDEEEDWLIPQEGNLHLSGCILALRGQCLKCRHFHQFNNKQMTCSHGNVASDNMRVCNKHTSSYAPLPTGCCAEVIEFLLGQAIQLFQWLASLVSLGSFGVCNCGEVAAVVLIQQIPTARSPEYRFTNC